MPPCTRRSNAWPRWSGAPSATARRPTAPLTWIAWSAARGAESALAVQRRGLAGEPGRDVLDVLVGQRGGHAVHDRVLALARLVVVQRPLEIVRPLAGEDRVVGQRRLLARRPVTCPAHLRGLLLARREVGAERRLRQRQRRRCRQNDAQRRAHLPLPP